MADISLRIKSDFEQALKHFEYLFGIKKPENKNG